MAVIIGVFSTCKLENGVCDGSVELSIAVVQHQIRAASDRLLSGYRTPVNTASGNWRASQLIIMNFRFGDARASHEIFLEVLVKCSWLSATAHLTILLEQNGF